MTGEISRGLPPFTYFTDQLGIIYYSHGVTVLNRTPEVRATCVYLPDASSEPQVIEWATGAGYRKYICAGLKEERTSLEHTDPSPERSALEQNLRYDASFNEHYLAVPHENIARVFSPYESVNELLRRGGGAGPGVPDRVRRSVVAGLQAFGSAGIPLADIGLYGGLQCGIGRADLSIHDVDLVVRGQRSYHRIVRRCRGNESRWLPDRVENSVVQRANALRRAQLSQVYVPFDGDELMIDVRTEPLPSEHSGADCAGNRRHAREQVEFQATVVDAAATLSLPVCYLVQPDDGGPTIHVVSSHHHMIGCAGEGDRVAVRGIAGIENTVHIINEAEHLVEVLEPADVSSGRV